MGQTTILLLAFLTGIIAFVLEGISIGTSSWAEVKGYDEAKFKNHLCNTTEGQNRTLLKSKGFWSYCNIELEPPVSSQNNESVDVDGLYDNVTDRCSRALITACYAVNISLTGPDFPESALEEEIAHYGTIFFLERLASFVACLCIGLQFCGVLTSFQAIWTMIPVLFTDCGVMFLFGAFFQLMTLVFYICALTYENMEVNGPTFTRPPGYLLSYAYSFYLGCGSFILGFITGVLYLLLARAYEKEEVWLKPMGTEKKGPKL